MSSIESIEPLSEYAPRQDEVERVESTDDQPKDDVMVPYVQAASVKQDHKTTIQSFHYTGKGSFIDRIF